MEVWAFEWGFEGRVGVLKATEEGKDIHLGAKYIIHENLTPNEKQFWGAIVSFVRLPKSDCGDTLADPPSKGY